MIIPIPPAFPFSSVSTDPVLGSGAEDLPSRHPWNLSPQKTLGSGIETARLPTYQHTTRCDDQTPRLTLILLDLMHD
jgi:hypothetical protein